MSTLRALLTVCWLGLLCSCNTPAPIGLPTPVALTGVTAVCAGPAHSCALASGAMYCWGDNTSGELGQGAGSLALWPVGLVVSGLGSGVTAIGCGGYIDVANSVTYFHSCAVVGGAVQCWGSNSNGQLGNNTTTNNPAPVSVSNITSGATAVALGGRHTCALVNGGVKCWGYNSSGQLGNGTNSDSYVPVSVTGLTSGVSAITAMQDFNCALTTAGAVKCWGDNTLGQIGVNTAGNSYNTAQTPTLGATAVSVAAGDYHTCAALTTGAVQCWGSEVSGQLGNGITSASAVLTPTTNNIAANATAVFAGLQKSCALVSGALKCFGENISGELGNGSTASAVNTPTAATQFGAATTMAFGEQHACVVLSSKAQCLGLAAAGQLGTDSSTSTTTIGTVLYQ